MAVLKALGGSNQVTIGNTGGGYPRRTTWTDPIPLADAGTPLNMYNPSLTDPLSIYKTQPAVRRVVGWAARQFGSVSWKAYQRVGDTDRRRKQDSPMERLLNSPAKFSTGFSLRQNLLIDYMLYDRWCLVFFPETRTQPEKFLRVHPSLLDVRTNWLGEVKQLVILNPTAGEPDIDITDAPVAFSSGWAGPDGGGISPLQTLRDILQESRRAVQWRDHQWENSPKLTGLLVHPGEYKAGEKRDAFLQSWRQWRDMPRAGGTPLLENGMDYKQLTAMSPKDAMDLEGRKLTNEEVTTAYFNYPELLGLRESTFSNMIAFRQMIHGQVLGPHYVDFAQAFNAGLVDAVDGRPKIYVEADRESAVAGSFLEQAQMLSTLTGRPIMTAAEGRARLNLPHLEGTDELIVPMNVTEGGQASPQDSGSQNRKPNTEPEQETPK